MSSSAVKRNVNMHILGTNRRPIQAKQDKHCKNHPQVPKTALATTSTTTYGLFVIFAIPLTTYIINKISASPYCDIRLYLHIVRRYICRGTPVRLDCGTVAKSRTFYRYDTLSTISSAITRYNVLI